MANQLKLVATIGPANTAVEASTDNGATWRAVAMTTVGSQQEGVLTGVTAGEYAGNSIKLRAVSFPAVVVSEPLARTVLAAAAGAAPTVTSFTPATQQSGLPITITGTGFTAESVVRITGLQAVTTFNGPTSLNATVPPGIQSPGPVTVQTVNGTGTSSTNFTLQAAASSLTANITTVGNSIVAGPSAGTGLGGGWVQYMATALPTTGYAVNNVNGITSQGGWAIANIEAHAADVDATYNSTAGVVNICFVMEGTNSISGGMTGQAYLDRLNIYCDARRARGWKVVQLTIPPQATATGANFNSEANSVNAVMRSMPQHYNSLLDLGRNLKCGNFAPSSADQVAWYYDGTHPTAVVNEIIGLMARDEVYFLTQAGNVKPDPANYPPNQVFPGERAIWSEVGAGAEVGLGAESNSIYNVLGSNQFQGAAQTQQQYPAKAGLCAFTEMTTGSIAPGFFALCNGRGTTGFSWLNQGLYFGAAGINIWSEGGVAANAVTGFGGGDRLRIEAYADKMIFYRNGTPFYTLVKTIVFPVHAGCVMSGGSNGATGRDSGVLNVYLGAG